MCACLWSGSEHGGAGRRWVSLGQLQLVQVLVALATVEVLQASYVNAAAGNKEAEPMICHTPPCPKASRSET